MEVNMLNKFGIAILLLLSLTFTQIYPEMKTISDNLSWYRDAVVYEAFARSFYDTDQDGKGDIKGLIAKLDYLNDGDADTDSDLGVTAIWLMPMFSSPSYHGYDVTNYYQINKDYGSNEDFDLLIKEAHKRGIKIIIDLVLNHTSDRHPYFIEAVKDKTSPKRDWFVWKNSIPSGWGQPWNTSANVWHKAGDSYYYGLFYFGMPDLNHHNPAVKAEIKKIIKFWLDKGVDGFRLDAIRYLTEEGPRAGQMDTASNQKVMAEFYAAAKKVKPDCVLVGEIWTDINTVSTYFKSDKHPAQVDSAFNFDLASAIINGVKNNDPLVIPVTLDIALDAYPKGAIDSTFLTNHDMDRIASIIGADTGKLKLAASVLLTLPGVPYLYYGEEIGIMGRKPDEHIRRPMKWEAGKFAGFTTAKRPWMKPDAANPNWNVAEMQKDPDSLLNHYKKMIRLRHKHIALRRGDYKTITVPNPNIYAFTRSYRDETVLVLHNFQAQKVEKVAVPGLMKPGTLLTMAPYETRVMVIKK
jgi:glycosidase